MKTKMRAFLMGALASVAGLSGCAVEVRQPAYADLYRTYYYPGYTDTYYYNYPNYYYSYFPYYYSNRYTYSYWRQPL